ncbi:MAG: Fic family protein [Xanthomonadales bacterium]|nr:Fic family protein [Xanthomonadales bacterium]MCC6560848.1 Fic family protein [Xanthomonadales bacterium]
MAPHAIGSELKKLLDDVQTWDEFDTYVLDERAVRLHHRLTLIHPFPNGNGRCARVFTDLYLEARGSGAFTWGSALARDAQRRSYLDAIRAADDRDYRALIDFVRR